MRRPETVIPRYIYWFHDAMKTYTAILLLACAALAQGFSKCRCGLFTNQSFGEFMLYEMPGIDVGSCDAHFQCKTLCEKEFRELTNNGDIYTVMEDGITTIGQFLCQELYEGKIDNEYVYNYYELCSGPWEFTEQQSQETLCCRNWEQYPCSTR
ncbi:uncharacterized protein LOC143034343 isoform X2 [Oratosquilla oratoria]|uniref:uncharacterized protein LOC143034343 isoform X2 n=1 Tax=Oratosquilla oratoria TaxID=337810 RepID=UPI003F76007E